MNRQGVIFPAGARVFPAGNVENLINKTCINDTFSSKGLIKKETEEIVGRQCKSIFLSQEGNSCHRKDIPVTAGISCRGKKVSVAGRKSLSQEGNSGHRKDIPVAVRKILLKEGYLCYGKEIPVKGMKFLLREGYSWSERPFYWKIGI